jgi:hypothetical protein
MTRRAFWMVSALSLLGMAAIPASASAPPSDLAAAEPTAAKREALVGVFPQSFPDRELLLRWDSRSAERGA